MIDSLTHKLKLIALTAFLGVLPLGCTNTTTTNEGCSQTSTNDQGCVQISKWTIEGNRITMRVKILNESNKFVSNLKPEDFQVETKDDLGIQLPAIKPSVILPKSINAKITPADVIILLDMSGSMKHQDSRQTKKLDGAIDAIEQFIEEANRENLPINVSIVPFGYGCTNNLFANFQVTEKSIKNNLIEATSKKLKRQLNQLRTTEVCAATDLYNPLTIAVKYLRSQSLPIVEKSDSATDIESETPTKQRAVILFSDGFHTYERPTEKQQFEQLKNLLQQQDSQVTVHTLGYGESLSELYSNARCGNTTFTEQELTDNKVIERENIIDKIIEKCQRKDNPQTSDINESKIEISEFIVDKPRLTEIAEVTGGIHQFPDNAEAAAKSLIDFLESLREYELTYQQPGSDRATQHETVVRVTSQNFASDPIFIRMCNFGCPPLRSPERVIILIGTFVLFILVGILPFIQWMKKLKEG